MFGNQHHGDSHHDFIGNRVEEGAKTGALIPATSEETIKPVGYRGNKEDQRAGKRRPAKGQIKRQHKKRDQDDAKQSKQRRDIKLHSDG